MIKKLLFSLSVLVPVILISIFIYAKSLTKISLPTVDSALKVEAVLGLEKGSLVDRDRLNEFILLLDKKKLDIGNYLLENRVVSNVNAQSRIMPNVCAKKNCLQRPVIISDVNPYIWEVLINIEDSRFLSHLGLDPWSILRATVVNISKGRYAQGGSTITQQLVKNVFLSNEKTLSRKFKEAIISLYVELTYKKNEIIEAYLNNVYWGSFNGVELRGVEAASNFYFLKNAKELDLYESMILVAMLKGPHYYHPIQKTERLLGRLNIIANMLIKNEVIDSYDKKLSAEYLMGMSGKLLGSNALNLLYFLNQSRDKETIYFDDYVLTSSAWTLKKRLDKKLNSAFDFEILKVSNTRERSYLSSYFKKNLKHQTGSILKPIIYSILLEEGVPTEIPVTPVVLELKSGKWQPRDHLGDSELSVSAKGAIQRSLNTPIVKLSMDYGFDELETKLIRYIPNLKTPLSEYPAQILGSIELSLEEVASAYGKFLSQACLSDGAKFVYSSLQDPSVTTISSRSKNLVEGLTFFGKTGTSNKSLDNWFVFHDGSELIIIWFGYLGARDGKGFRLSGASTAYEILKGYLLSRGRRMGEFSCD